MVIIRSLSAIYQENIDGGRDIYYESVQPQFATFLAFRLIGSPDIKVATLNNGIYFSFDEEKFEWVESSTPVFQNHKRITEGIQKLSGKLQFIVRILENESIELLQISYESRYEITEYLFKYALTEYFKVKCTLCFTTRATSSGNIETPVDLIIKSDTTVKISPLHQPPRQGFLKNRQILLDPPLPPYTPVQITFEVTPEARFVFGESQIDATPCILLNCSQYTNVRSPMRSDAIQDEDNNVLDFPLFCVDFVVDVTVMDREIEHAKAIAYQVLDKIRRDGRIYLPAFDYSVGIWSRGGIVDLPHIDFSGGIGFSPDPKIKGGMASLRFQAIVKNVSI